MPQHHPSPEFHNAATYLSNNTSLSKVSTTTKLELYGVFKYLTVSPNPQTSRPSYFDMSGRAKWDAWSAAGKTYEDRGVEAEKRYLDIAQDLGWINGSAPLPRPGFTSPSSSDIEERLSEDPGGCSSSYSSHGGAGGMGTSVSAMVPPSLDEEDAKTIHGLAVSNNVSALSSFLQVHQDVDVNESDEHGYTPLHLACDRGNAAVVELLLSRGADRSLKDPDEFTASELAKIAGHDGIVALMQKF